MNVLTILERDRPGLLAEITTLLENAGVDVLDISGTSKGTYAVINLYARPARRGHRVLTDAGHTVFTAEHQLVRIEDRPGALAELSRLLANEEVDIRSIHFVGRDAGHCIVALDTADPARATEVLSELLIAQPADDA